MIDFGDLDPKTELDLLGEEDWEDLVDEIELDDPAYQQDAAVVADLFRQMESQNSLAPPIVPAAPLEELPQVATQDPINPSDCYTATPDASHLRETGVFKSWLDVRRTSPRVWVLAGVVGVAAIALVSVWCHSRERLPPQSPPRSLLNISTRET